MSSGATCIVLEDGVCYDNFQSKAEKWAESLGLTITSKLDGISERLWFAKLGSAELILTYDDWFPELHLDPKNKEASEIIAEIGNRIQARKPPYLP